MTGKINGVGVRFDRSADSYDAHSDVQRTMADMLMASIAEPMNDGAADRLDILEIGCGTGALTHRLTDEWPAAHITALDLAPAMIERAKRRVSSNRACFIHADAEAWVNVAKAASFDLIVSNACFQWLASPGITMRRLRSLLRIDGSLIFATFGPATFCELHEAFAEAYRINGLEPQRHGLSFQSSNQWVDMLKDAGWSNIECQRRLHTETHASARDFLHAVKAMGASASEAVGSRGLGPRRLFADMYKEYEERFGTPGGVTATYELLLIRSELKRR
ncbi:malonyl-ACP O-methyltransferase BioC [Cohnella faecalis]|uniref:Malonyl-[acyl-carrier protein] O-methyltransferase n=1 Tax=Cohnella faecalis TaxID=2315694 RepID=A0A398CNX8_9BACL|nr:malonyl-ACP O-methyltransferase BioC [Cohnella faecalis]RIE02989.1 malonyl-[acyl-carrier protein] O-methyltransferase BioC [Cohnella faecalis]